MKELIIQIKNLQSSNFKKEVDARLEEFKQFNSKNKNEWFSELCFCLLTANSKAQTAISIQKELGHKGFMLESKKNLSSCILKNKHRFHNNKAKFIVEARKHVDLKHKVKRLVNKSGEKNARDWLVKNVKGFGYKEGSHFLRNIGYNNIAILDRHIINLMIDHKLIDEKPKIINRNKYLDIESKFLNLANKIGMSSAELDLYMWYLKTGEILK